MDYEYSPNPNSVSHSICSLLFKLCPFFNTHKKMSIPNHISHENLFSCKSLKKYSVLAVLVLIYPSPNLSWYERFAKCVVEWFGWWSPQVTTLIKEPSSLVHKSFGLFYQLLAANKTMQDWFSSCRVLFSQSDRVEIGCRARAGYSLY